jgi:hypothetical protein
MCLEMRYRGRTVTAADVEFIRHLIASNPGVSRRALSVKLCEAWQWTQANGALRDMVARGLMLLLHRAGHVVLPDKKQCPLNNVARHPWCSPKVLSPGQICLAKRPPV